MERHIKFVSLVVETALNSQRDERLRAGYMGTPERAVRGLQGFPLPFPNSPLTPNKPFNNNLCIHFFRE